jgi:hypothetical protein
MVLYYHLVGSRSAGPIASNISSGADADPITSQRKTDSEGIEDPSIGINLEEIQCPYDTLNTDHFTDPMSL